MHYRLFLEGRYNGFIPSTMLFIFKPLDTVHKVHNIYLGRHTTSNPLRRQQNFIPSGACEASNWLLKIIINGIFGTVAIYVFEKKLLARSKFAQGYKRKRNVRKLDRRGILVKWTLKIGISCSFL